MERGVHLLHCFDVSCIQAKRENRADTEVTNQHVFVVSEYHSPQHLGEGVLPHSVRKVHPSQVPCPSS